MVKYVANILRAVDYLGNALAGGNPRETISSRAGRWAANHDNALAHFVCAVLDLVDQGHCRRAAANHDKPTEAFDDRPVAGLVLLIIACAVVYVLYGNLLGVK